MVSPLTFKYCCRGMWPNDLISTGCEEDDISSILSVYCYHLVRDKPGKQCVSYPILLFTYHYSTHHNSYLIYLVSDVFVVTEQDLGQVLTGLMEGLYQVLGAIKSFDTKV